jgi:hypothetical protein
MMGAMLLGLLLGGVGTWWLSVHAQDGTLLPLLPSAEKLSLSALGVLAVGWVLATVSPRITATLALALLPGMVYAVIVIHRVDDDRATSLIGTVLALAALGIGCAMQAYRTPAGAARRRYPPRPRLPRAARR